MAKFKKLSFLSFLLGLTINLTFGAMKSPNVPNPSNATAPTLTTQTNNGLENLGNTCFMNSTIQVLSNVGPLTEFLLKQNATDPVISSYIKLLKEFRTQGQASIYPIDFRGQNLGTLNKNRLQNQINAEISEQTQPDRIEIEKLRNAERQKVVGTLTTQEQALLKVELTKSNYDQICNLNKKIDQQTYAQLKQKAEYQQHLENIQKIKFANFSKYKNALVQHYGTEEMARKRFNTSSQQDATEFLGEILDKMIYNNEQRISLKQNSANPSFELAYKNTCSNNNTHTFFSETSFSNTLNLDIINQQSSVPFNTLDQCLSYLLQREEIVEDYTCQQCNKKSNLKRLTKIKDAPNTLIIQLNRFSIALNDTGDVITVKKPNPIKLPLQLNLKNYLVQPKDTVYDLIGFVCHNGETANSGHYISYAKDYRNQNWYHYNDSMVEQMTLNLIGNIETLGYLPTGRFKKDLRGNDTNIDEGIDSTPYILFYQKREIPLETTPTPPATTATTTATAAVTPMEIDDIQAEEFKRQQAQEEAKKQTAALKRAEELKAQEEALRLASQIMQQEQEALKKQQEKVDEEFARKMEAEELRIAEEKLKAEKERNRVLKARLAALQAAKRRKLNQ